MQSALHDAERVDRLADLAQRQCYVEGRNLPHPARDVAHVTNSSGLLGRSPDAANVKATVIVREAEALAKELTARRHYITQSSDGRNVLDPRFLVFEYLVTFVLHKAQVELIHEFLEARREGRSRVQQMIMGQGKTTVVAPLLCLILADGESLVTQVVLRPLLEQTLGIMRRLFSSVIIKKTYTLTFDRSEPVAAKAERAAALYKKILRARRERGIVVTTPEVVKSLELKYIDLLQQVEQVEESNKIPLEPLNDSSVEAQRIKQSINEVREQELVADELGKIIKLWGKEEGGVLLLDEVDLILHPLRSELNFPIGQWHKLQLSPSRWDLPIHITEALFYSQVGRIAMEEFHLNAGVEGLLRDIGNALQEGADAHRLQLRPHLILLDSSFYHLRLKPLLMLWSLLWLRSQSWIRSDLSAGEEVEASSRSKWTAAGMHRPSTRTGVPLGETAEAAMEAYLLGCPTEEESAVWLGACCGGQESMQALNLARDWLNTYLPHILSKVNRVSYGVLNDNDAANFGPLMETMPRTRRVLAVPFLAKDAPSRASEFAHPDILIGLSVLGYRYSGLRRNDVLKVWDAVPPMLSSCFYRFLSYFLCLVYSSFSVVICWFSSFCFISSHLLLTAILSSYSRTHLLFRQIVSQLKSDLQKETGPVTERPARIRFQKWLDRAKLSARRKTEDGTIEASIKSAFDNLLPLEFLQVDDEKQLDLLFKTMAEVPEVVLHWLTSHVFPAVMKNQVTKLTATGMDLGSDMLFGVRLGFSGTPSNLLPRQLQPCHFQPGSDAKVLRLLTASEHVKVERLQKWTVESLLTYVAQSSEGFSCLIDTGALVTGLSNVEVAR